MSNYKRIMQIPELLTKFKFYVDNNNIKEFKDNINKYIYIKDASLIFYENDPEDDTDFISSPIKTHHFSASLPDNSQEISSFSYKMPEFSLLQYAIYANKIEFVKYLLNDSFCLIPFFSLCQELNNTENITEDSLNEAKIALIESRNCATRINLLQEAIYCCNPEIVDFLIQEMVVLDMIIDEAIDESTSMTPLQTAISLYNSFKETLNNKKGEEKEKIRLQQYIGNLNKIIHHLLHISDPFLKNEIDISAIEMTLPASIDLFEEILHDSFFDLEKKRHFLNTMYPQYNPNDKNGVSYIDLEKVYENNGDYEIANLIYKYKSVFNT